MQEPLPGATLALITKEHEMIEHIRHILSKKRQLDEQYVKDLRRLRNSVNPKCDEGAIGSLLKPVIDLLDNEITQRETPPNGGVSRPVPPLPSSPNHPSKLGVSPSSLYEPLEKHYKEAQKRHDIAGSWDNAWELRAWYRWTDDPRFGSKGWQIPITDRKYRKAVCYQHAAVSSALSWHTSRLPEVLEDHQSNAELLKKTLLGVIRNKIRLHSNIVQDCSVALDSIDKFSSLFFVAPKYDLASKEQNNPTLRPFVYHNFWLDSKESPPPIFGTTREKLDEIIQALRCNPLESFDNPGPRLIVDEIVNLERQCSRGVDLNRVTFERSTPSDVLGFALFNQGPLLPLDDKTILQYKGGVPRRKIASLLPPDVYVLRTFRKLSQRKLDPYFLAYCLTHRKDTDIIIKDIFRK